MGSCKLTTWGRSGRRDISPSRATQRILLKRVSLLEHCYCILNFIVGTVLLAENSRSLASPQEDYSCGVQDGKSTCSVGWGQETRYTVLETCLDFKLWMQVPSPVETVQRVFLILHHVFHA